MNLSREDMYGEVITELQHFVSMFPNLRQNVESVVPEIEALKHETPALGTIDPRRQMKEIAVQQKLCEIAYELPKGDHRENFFRKIAVMMERIMM